MIRPVTPDDTALLVEMARETGVFKAIEIVALREVLDDYHSTNQAAGHRAIAALDQGQAIGFAYFAPAAMTDRTWYLYWIAVSKAVQAKGTGGKLLRQCEEEIRAAHGRLFLIETSSLPHYEPTRRFYLKHGYDQTCVLRDFYADGDDMVIFAKHLGRRNNA